MEQPRTFSFCKEDWLGSTPTESLDEAIKQAKQCVIDHDLEHRTIRDRGGCKWVTVTRYGLHRHSAAQDLPKRIVAGFWL